jgi:hypothetical protein
MYVDDILLFGTSLSAFTFIKQHFDHAFGIKDLGVAKYFLGLEIAHSSKGISVSQRKYCLDLLQDASLLSCKPACTPLDPSSKLHQDSGNLLVDASSFRRLIGRLLYLTSTRPDIAYALQQLSQYMSAPSDLHHHAAIRVLRYLKQSPGLGLFFPRDNFLQIHGFSDADWARCLDTRRSVSGYCFFLGRSLVSWKSKYSCSLFN